MLKFIKAFEKTVLVFIKLFMILILYMVFYRFFCDFSPELSRVSRVSVIVTTTFLLLCFVMIKLFGSLTFGKKATRELALSVILAVIFTDIFAYCQLCVMEKRIMPFIAFFMVLFVHTIMVFVIVKLGNDLYFAVNPPKNVVLICTELNDSGKIMQKLKYYQNRYKVTKIVYIYSPSVYDDIDVNDGAVLYDLPPVRKKNIIDYCYKNSKDIYLLPDLSDLIINNSQSGFFDDSLVLTKNMSGLSFEQRLVKRTADIIISLAAIIISSPIMLIEALAIKLEDGGKVIYRQERSTINGRTFSVFKFRTMTEDIKKNSGAIVAQKNDKRITKTGKFLRKTRMDELPQMFNILIGDMSIVGPRPEWNRLSNEYVKDLPEFEYRLKVKAGLTGYAQIMGRYSTTPRDKLMLDLYYIENYSFMLDLKIFFQTIITVLTPEKSE